MIKSKPLTAGQIKAIVLNILKYEYNADCWLQNNVAIPGRKFTGRKGLPDIIGFAKKYNIIRQHEKYKSGCIVACEAKTENDSLSEEQIKLLQDIDKAGGISLVAYQEGIKVVVKSISDYLKM